jgi:hypothetical protein
MSQVIEHIAYLNAVLIKLERLALSDDGEMIISTVNVAYWSSRIKLLKGIWQYEEYGLFNNTHLRFFSVDGFEQYLKNAGYKVRDISPLFFIPKIRVIAISFLFIKLKLSKSKIYKWYRKKFKNFISYQLVFRAKSS